MEKERSFFEFSEEQEANMLREYPDSKRKMRPLRGLRTIVSLEEDDQSNDIAYRAYRKIRRKALIEYFLAYTSKQKRRPLW